MELSCHSWQMRQLINFVSLGERQMEIYPCITPWYRPVGSPGCAARPWAVESNPFGVNTIPCLYPEGVVFLSRGLERSDYPRGDARVYFHLPLALTPLRAHCGAACHLASGQGLDGRDFRDAVGHSGSTRKTQR
jgi:hypothetical protein